MAAKVFHPPAAETAIPRLPRWVSSGRVRSPDEAAFLSGTALGHLSQLVTCDAVPQDLLRARLALRASEACVAFSGRPERARELRDEVHLLRAADQPGPAGWVFQQWQGVVAHRHRTTHWRKCVPPDVLSHLDRDVRSAEPGHPVAQASATMEAVLTAFPHDVRAALVLADLTLARAARWDYIVPVLGAGMARRDMHLSGAALGGACHRAVVACAVVAAREAAELARGATRLRSVAPQLRAKGAGRAVEMFLSRDAVSPSGALADVMSDRAARRLCDRLVSLGAVRELTGRKAFRLYGV